ncbi:hypothetical protein LJK87_44030 [Paenibacillus sp. P25]|nr:hypothetical protein LJK87_44030 [Paenibacillus sp. P25]
MWEPQWSQGDGGGKGPGISATVNSNTGAILQYSKYDFKPVQDADFSSDNAEETYSKLKEKALQYVKQLLPAYAHELYGSDLELSGMSKEALAHMNAFNFDFRRKVGGIFTEYDSVHLSLNRTTGELQYYGSNLSPFAYPAEHPALLSEDEAKSKLLSQYKIELQYALYTKDNGVIPYGGAMPMEKYNVMVAAGEIKPGEKPAPPEVRLVYALKPTFAVRGPVFLDAVTGNGGTGTTARS